VLHFPSLSRSRQLSSSRLEFGCSKRVTSHFSDPKITLVNLLLQVSPGASKSGLNRAKPLISLRVGTNSALVQHLLSLSQKYLAVPLFVNNAG
jgi:hypothetical protein